MKTETTTKYFATISASSKTCSLITPVLSIKSKIMSGSFRKNRMFATVCSWASTVHSISANFSNDQIKSYYSVKMMKSAFLCCGARLPTTLMNCIVLTNCWPTILAWRKKNKWSKKYSRTYLNKCLNIIKLVSIKAKYKNRYLLKNIRQSIQLRTQLYKLSKKQRGT